MRPAHTVALIALMGCGTEESRTARLVAVDGTEPVSVQLHDTVGTGTIPVSVRQVNSYGVGVGGGSAFVAVRGGATIPAGTVQFDSTGYGTVPVTVPANTIAEIQVQSAELTTDLGSAASIYSIADRLPSLPLAATQLLPDSLQQLDFMAAGTSGLAVGSDDEVWWVPTEAGHIPHQVADLPFAIDGMWGVHLDADGVLDLLVWADSQVVLLRGRSEGGYGWGGAWTGGDRNVVGVIASDVNGDRLVDVVVALSSDTDALIEVMVGDGRWNFEPNAPLELSYPVEGITASDDNLDGDPDITVLSGATGVLRRYTVTEDGWAGGTPPEIAQYKADPGSLLFPPVNLNNEGAPEIAVIGPPQAGAQELVFYVLGEPPTKYPLSFYPFHATFADVDGNGAQDLIALEDNVLNAIRFVGEEDRFISQATVGLGDSGPVVARDYDGDGLAELAILNDGITIRKGQMLDTGVWSVSAPGMRSYSIDLMGPMSVGDIDGNGKVDVIGMANPDGIPAIKGWWFVDGGDGPSLQTAGKVNTQPGLLLDFAHCDTNAYALVQGAESTTLHRAKIESSGGNFSLSDMWGAKPVTGSHIDCGWATSSARGVAVSDGDGNWVLYKNDGTEVDSGNFGPTAGIGMADTDGNGVDEIYNCAETNCSILGADFNNDGREELVVSGFETRVNGGPALPSGGWLHAVDVDSDGRMDLTTFDDQTGTHAIYRGMKNGLAPAVSLRTTRSVIGPGFLADVDQSGDLEFVSVDEAGKLVHSRTAD